MSDNYATIKDLMKRIKKRIEQRIDAFCEMPLTLRILIVLLIFLVAIFLSVIFGDGAGWIDLLGRKDKGETLRFIGIAMGGVLLAIQAILSYRRAKGMEDTVKHTEQGQRQERLKNAIEHLGHEGYSVRLGGAYELFHLAKDTEELRQTILEILCAHIRRTTRSEDYQEKYGRKPSEEIQSLLTLLFVQDHKVFDGCRINLQGSRLNGASLPKARLQKADLWKAHLEGANLMYAQLQEANLRSAQLQGADISEVQLQGANLSEARLQGAVLNHAQLQGAMLSHAQLQDAVLQDAHLQGAYLSEAQLQGADLRNTQLQGIVSSDDESQGYGFLDFAERIRHRVDQESDFSTVVFSGGLSEDEVNHMTMEIPDSEWVADLEEILKPHIGLPPSNELPADSGANTGTYTEEDAEQWIAEYQEAVSRDDVHS